MNHLIKEASSAVESHVIGQVRKHALPLTTAKDLDPLMKRIGDSRYVLLGESTHGTHEFYTWRTALTKRLIREKKFSFIAVEGDWPDCYLLNRYVKGYPVSGKSALDVLGNFRRWPTWMWANWEIIALAEWLRKYNLELPLEERVGFYGLDVYSLGESLEAILDYLEDRDPDAYETAKKAAACFEPYGYEGHRYGQAASYLPASCEGEVLDLLMEIRSKIHQYNTDPEAVFSTEQNALIAQHAEHYYREMMRGGPASWNIRDKHMVETLERLVKYHGQKSRAIVWAHNTHIGDARATDMLREGLVNVGELVTHRYYREGVVKVGFGSYKGEVIAGRNWGANMQRLDIPPAMEGSWEHMLHTAGPEDKLLLMDPWKSDSLFNQSIGHRAVGVVYNPEYENKKNYVPSLLPTRYDAFIYLEETSAVHPLHIQPDGSQMPETYPWGT